jgi:hypothetical protein
MHWEQWIQSEGDRGVVKAGCSKCGLDKVAPHDRRTCVRLCHEAGWELEQIQFLLAM